jgi:hypothetical protein
MIHGRNCRALAQLADPMQSVEAVRLQSTAMLVALAKLSAWWTAAIETALAAAFLLPARLAVVRYRHAILLLFACTTYLVGTVATFGWGLDDDRRRPVRARAAPDPGPLRGDGPPRPGVRVPLPTLLSSLAGRAVAAAPRTRVEGPNGRVEASPQISSVRAARLRDHSQLLAQNVQVLEQQFPLNAHLKGSQEQVPPPRSGPPHSQRSQLSGELKQSLGQVHGSSPSELSQFPSPQKGVAVGVGVGV